MILHGRFNKGLHQSGHLEISEWIICYSVLTFSTLFCRPYYCFISGLALKRAAVVGPFWKFTSNYTSSSWFVSSISNRHNFHYFLCCTNEVLNFKTSDKDSCWPVFQNEGGRLFEGALILLPRLKKKLYK